MLTPEAVRVPGNIDDLVCEVCNAGHHEDKIILCDRCDKGFHLFCLSPPLDDVPEGDWICPLCIEMDSDASFFREGPEMTISDMIEHSSSFARNYWGDARLKKVRPIFILCFVVDSFFKCFVRCVYETFASWMRMHVFSL